MILTKNSAVDGQASFEKGVDTYRAPSRVPRNQSCLLINCTTRQDYIGPRPGWRQVGLRFVLFNTITGQYEADTAGLAAFQDGLFQGFTGYVPDQGEAHLVFSISGKLFRVDPLGNKTVQELKLPASDKGQPTKRPLVWFKQAEQFLVVQDNQSLPIIYDGATVRRANSSGQGAGTDADGTPLTEVPVGNVMEYSQGRLWVTLPNGNSFVGSDLVYGPTGTAAYSSRDSVLKFTENAYWNGGKAFAVPDNMGPIRAMATIANLDTSLGQGPMQVFTPAGAFSVQAPYDRATWFNLTYPIKSVSLTGKGFLSQRGIVKVNGDLWGRTLDGIDSFMVARRDFGSWGNRSMSYEVIRHLKDDDRNLLEYESGCLFDNRKISTTAPQLDQTHGVYHKGLVALDFIPLTSMGGSEPPCWDGLWIGPDILQVATITSRGVDHCYAAVLALPNAEGHRHIELWELTRSEGHDTASDGSTGRISRVSEGPKLDFQNKVEQKQLEACDIWLSKIKGVVEFNLYYRPDEHPCWFFWKHWQICAKTARCTGDAVGGCMPPLNLKQQFRTRVGALRPPDLVVDGTHQVSRTGYTFQYRLEVLGECEVNAVRLMANKVVEARFGAPPGSECEEVVCCEPNDFIPYGGVNEWPDDNIDDTGVPVVPVAPPVGGGPIITEPGDPAPDVPILQEGGTPIVVENPYVGYAPPPEPPIIYAPPLAPPAWPIPDPYVCPGQAYDNSFTVYDPLHDDPLFNGGRLPVAIAPPDDPAAYLDSLAAAPGALDAWSQTVWANFLTNHPAGTYSQARLVWYYTHVRGWMAFTVFPAQAGGYSVSDSLFITLAVEYCPTP